MRSHCRRVNASSHYHSSSHTRTHSALPGHGQQQGGAHPTTITTARSVVGNRSFAVAGPRGASAEEQRALSIPTHLSPTSQPRRLVSSPAPISHVHPPTPPLHTDATCHARLGMTRGGSVRGGFVHCGEICVGLIGRSTLPPRGTYTSVGSHYSCLMHSLRKIYTYM